MDNKDIAGWENPGPDVIEEIFSRATTIAVVGLSSNPDRPSYEVAAYLQAQGYKIIPVNPGEKEILGEKSYPDLTSIGHPVDVVDVFRRGETTPSIVEEAIKIGAKYIWLQQGVVSEESYRLARRAGKVIVMDRCMLREHRQLGV